MGREEVETTGQSKAFWLCWGLKKNISTREVRTFPRGRESKWPVRGSAGAVSTSCQRGRQSEALNTPHQVWGPPSTICHQTLIPVILDTYSPKWPRLMRKANPRDHSRLPRDIWLRANAAGRKGYPRPGVVSILFGCYLNGMLILIMAIDKHCREVSPEMRLSFIKGKIKERHQRLLGQGLILGQGKSMPQHGKEKSTGRKYQGSILLLRASLFTVLK